MAIVSYWALCLVSFRISNNSESGSVYLGFVVTDTDPTIQIPEETKWCWKKITSIDL